MVDIAIQIFYRLTDFFYSVLSLTDIIMISSPTIIVNAFTSPWNTFWSSFIRCIYIQMLLYWSLFLFVCLHLQWVKWKRKYSLYLCLYQNWKTENRPRGLFMYGEKMRASFFRVMKTLLNIICRACPLHSFTIYLPSPPGPCNTWGQGPSDLFPGTSSFWLRLALVGEGKVDLTSLFSLKTSSFYLIITWYFKALSKASYCSSKRWADIDLRV